MAADTAEADNREGVAERNQVAAVAVAAADNPATPAGCRPRSAVAAGVDSLEEGTAAEGAAGSPGEAVEAAAEVDSQVAAGTAEEVAGAQAVFLSYEPTSLRCSLGAPHFASLQRSTILASARRGTVRRSTPSMAFCTIVAHSSASSSRTRVAISS